MLNGLPTDAKTLREGFNADGRKFKLIETHDEYAVVGYDNKSSRSHTRWVYWGGWYFPKKNMVSKDYARTEALLRFEAETTTIHDDEDS